MTKSAALGLAACGLLVATAAQAAVIDFAGYAAGTRIDGTLTIGAVTFSSSSDTLLIDDFGAGKAICAFDGVGCVGTLALSFDPGVNNFSYDFSGDDLVGSQISFIGETDRLAFIGRYFADGDPTTRDPGSARFPGLRLLGLSSNDPGGVAFGDFSFTLSVPEPATWALMIAGFGLVGAALRRRVTKVRFAG